MNHWKFVIIPQEYFARSCRNEYYYFEDKHSIQIRTLRIWRFSLIFFISTSEKTKVSELVISVIIVWSSKTIFFFFSKS